MPPPQPLKIENQLCKSRTEWRKMLACLIVKARLLIFGKRFIICLQTLYPALVFAQFPAPDSFYIYVHYITMDQADWCDNQVVYGPAYCNLLSWQIPDTSSSPATLAGYRIYKDDQLFLTTTATQADTTGAFTGDFYVAAIYENPAGESPPSNVVTITDLPIATREATINEQIAIEFDFLQQVLMIQGAQYARTLQIYNVQGVQVSYTRVVSALHTLEGLVAGIYWVAVRDKDGRVWARKVLVW